MSDGGHIDAEAARRLLATLEADAPRARNRVDITGEAGDLARVVELALLTVPAARIVGDPGARRELAAFDRATATELDRWFEAPFRREAAMRAAIFQARGSLHKQPADLATLMRAYRQHDESTRRSARTELDRLLDNLYEETAVHSVTRTFNPTPAQPAAPRPTATATKASPTGILALPSPELIQALSAGATLDATTLAALAATTAQPSAKFAATHVPTSFAPPPDAAKFFANASEEERANFVAGASESGHANFVADAEARETMAREQQRADAKALRDLLRALAESVLGAPPTSFGAWRSACAAFHVADFRPAPLAVLGQRSARTLAFEHVAGPLTRPGAIAAPDADAWSSSTFLFGAARELAGDAYAGALVATGATRAFVSRALRDRPNDPARAARALALCCAFRFAASRFHGHDNGDDLRAAYDETFDASPPLSIARWWSLEQRLAAAPGEQAALYPHTAALSLAILRGVQLASTLRDTHDEDWFRNPRLTPELLRDRALLAEPASEGRLIAWLLEHAHL